MDEILRKIDEDIQSYEMLKEAHYKSGKIHLEKICQGKIIEAKRIKEIIQSEQNDDKYTIWLENMVILLSSCYQETHDILLKKTKEGNKAYFEMPTIQGTLIGFAVNKISKLICNGTITNEELDEFVNWIIEKYQKAEEE